MGIENPVHLLFIAIVALIVLGPKRLPELARALGHGIREFREAIGQQGAPLAEPTLGSEEPVAVPDPAAPPAPGPSPAPAAAPASDPSGGTPAATPAAAPASDPPGPVGSGDAPDRRPL